MKRWTSKRPVWPLLAASGCLFVLAMAASSSWDDRCAVPQPPDENLLATQPAPTVVTLEPELDDAELVVASPLDLPEPEPPSFVAVPPAPSTDLVLSSPSVETSVPEKQLFNPEVLLQMRDLVQSLVDRLPDQEQLIEAVIPRHQVQVSSANDRLAMLDNRDRPDFDQLDSGAPELATEEVAEDVQVPDVPSEAAEQTQEQTEVVEKEEPPLALPPVPQVEQSIVAPRTEQSILAPRTEQSILAPRAEQSVLAPRTEQSILARRPERSVVEPAPVEEEAAPLLSHRPQVLFDQLEALENVPQASQWAEQVASKIRQLTDEAPTEDTDALALLEELRQAVDEGAAQTSNLSDYVAQQDWLQAIQALERRLGIWQVLLDPAQQQTGATELSATQPDLFPTLGEIATLLESDANGSDWREYLMLDRIAAASSQGAGIDLKSRSTLAYEVLDRMSDQMLTPAQVQFLATEPLHSLRQLLQPWAAQTVDLDRLTALIERYETGRELRYATAIARAKQQLHWSANPSWQALADHLDQYYRSSNMRIALSSELLNRMVPKQQPKVAPVRENIAGAKVRGNSRTTTNVKVHLLPDPNSWQFALEAYGKVYSNTRSETWPARVRNSAKMQYEVKKKIVIDQQGLQVSPAKSSAKGRHDLIGVDSQLDSVPLFGALLREIARNQNRKSRPKAMSQVKSKVAQQARQRMDKQADSKFSNLEQKFRDNVLAPIGQLALIADPVAMYTTKERAVMQLRLANYGQLGAHTPRPLAPADSFASFQMHETVLNNAFVGLGLEGRRMNIDELFHFLAEKLGYVNPELPEDLPARAVIEFAARDAILVSCDGDHLNLLLSIRELAHGRDKIRSFKVHVHFRPKLDGLDVRLVRDGTLQFSGRRLKTGPRVVLHSVIGKLFPKDQEVRMIAGKLQDDPRLAGMMVTQLVIDDGWIGLALGPAHAERNAWRSPSIAKSSQSTVR